MQDLFNMDLNTGITVAKSTSTLIEGLYKPKMDLVKDKKTGYRARIRFLPNFLKNPTDPTKPLGAFDIVKPTHYINLPEYKELMGYYDQQRTVENGDGNCPLYTTYWKLSNSNNVIDKENAKKIGYQTKWYSYVLVIEDKQQPELEGKILIYGYGKKIKDKIELERTGEITGQPCNVFDPSIGKDFNLYIQQQGEFSEYSLSGFSGSCSSLTINGKNLPTEEINGRVSIAQQYQENVKKFLLNREVELEEFSPKRWTVEQSDTVDKIISIVTGNPISAANNSISKASTIQTTEVVSTVIASSDGSEVDPDDFFDNM